MPLPSFLEDYMDELEYLDPNDTLQRWILEAKFGIDPIGTYKLLRDRGVGAYTDVLAAPKRAIDIISSRSPINPDSQGPIRPVEESLKEAILPKDDTTPLIPPGLEPIVESVVPGGGLLTAKNRLQEVGEISPKTEEIATGIGRGITGTVGRFGLDPSMYALGLPGLLGRGLGAYFGIEGAKAGGERIGTGLSELEGGDTGSGLEAIIEGGGDLLASGLALGHSTRGAKEPISRALPEEFSRSVVWEAPKERITGVVPEPPMVISGREIGPIERRVLEGKGLTLEELAKSESDPFGLGRAADEGFSKLSEEMKIADDFWKAESERIKRGVDEREITAAEALRNEPFPEGPIPETETIAGPGYFEIKPILKDMLAPESNLPGGREAGVIDFGGGPKKGPLSEQADLLHRLLKGSKQTKVNVAALDRTFQEMGLPLSPEMKADLPGLLKELSEKGYARSLPGGTYSILSGAGKGLKVEAPKSAGPSDLEQQLQATLNSIKKVEPTVTKEAPVVTPPEEKIQATAPIEEVKAEAPKQRIPRGNSFEVVLSDGSIHKVRGPNADVVKEYVTKKLEGSDLKVANISEPMSSIERAAKGIKEPSKPISIKGKEEGGFINHPAVKVLNAVKSIAYGGDIGHLLRQGKQMNAELLFSRNADKVFKQFPVLFKAAKSEAFFNDFHKKLAADPDISAMVRDFKLDMPGLGEHLKEEAFHGGELAESIPLIGKYYVKPSNRVYTTGLNYLRAEVAKQGIESLRSKGFTMENAPEKYRSLARGINIISQRGDFNPAYQKIFSDASALFGAPRAKAARLQQIPELFKNFESGRLARRSMAKAMALNVGLIAILKAKYGDDLEFVTDPKRTDYLKLRKGNVTVDPLMGLGVTIRTAARIKEGEAVSPYTGKKYPVTPGTAISRELTGMIAPGVAAGFQALFGKDFQGFQKDRISALANVLPLTYRQIEEIYKEEGIEGIIFIILQMGGEGVDTFNYDEAKAEQERLKAERSIGSSSRQTGRRGTRQRRYSF